MHDHTAPEPKTTPVREPPQPHYTPVIPEEKPPPARPPEREDPPAIPPQPETPPIEPPDPEGAPIRASTHHAHVIALQ